MNPIPPNVQVIIPDPFSTGYPFAILICCPHCKSQGVTRDAVTRWDNTNQLWEVSGIFDNAECDDCGEINLVERFAGPNGEDLGPVTEFDKYKGED